MTSQPAPDPSTDPTLAVAERQLVLLGELAEIAMAAARAFGASAVASAIAEERILADEYFVPEVGRARACGARDAADSLQKATRAVRLTLKLEMAVAEIVRDVRAGIVTHAYPAGYAGISAEAPGARDRSVGVLAGPPAADRDSDASRLERDAERLVEFERPEVLSRAPFRATIYGLGAAADRIGWTIAPPDLDYGTSPPETKDEIGRRVPRSGSCSSGEPPRTPRTPSRTGFDRLAVASFHLDGEAVGSDPQTSFNGP